MNINLEGKNAIVTGSAQGIGKAIALKLAQAGANIVISDINEEKGNETVKEIENLGRKSVFVKSDVSKEENAKQLIDETVKTLGSIDILVNNAGITRDTLLMRMKEQDWDLVISINLKGVFNCIKAAIRPMMKQRTGKIVNMASIIGIMGNAGQANYAASKAGVIALTKSTAKEVASRGINVNAIAPGFIQTAMTDAIPESEKTKYQELIPLGRLGTTDDIANATLFLSSEMSDYITGQTIVVDGGMVMY